MTTLFHKEKLKSKLLRQLSRARDVEGTLLFGVGDLVTLLVARITQSVNSPRKSEHASCPASKKIILIHGNGGGTGTDYWFPYVKREFESMHIPVIAETFPDNVEAKASVWLPHIEKLGADEHTILIGHSSGAVAALRYAETHKLLGTVLVGVNYTDLGIESEKISGYYDHPWKWGAIKKNQKWSILFASLDDPFIPIAEPRHIKEQLDCEYHEYADRGHFGTVDPKLGYNKPMAEFPELVEAVKGRTGGEYGKFV